MYAPGTESGSAATRLFGAAGKKINKSLQIPSGVTDTDAQHVKLQSSVISAPKHITGYGLKKNGNGHPIYPRVVFHMSE